MQKCRSSRKTSTSRDSTSKTSRCPRKRTEGQGGDRWKELRHLHLQAAAAGPTAQLGIHRAGPGDDPNLPALETARHLWSQTNGVDRQRWLLSTPKLEVRALPQENRPFLQWSGGSVPLPNGSESRGSGGGWLGDAEHPAQWNGEHRIVESARAQVPYRIRSFRSGTETVHPQHQWRTNGKHPLGTPAHPPLSGHLPDPSRALLLFRYTEERLCGDRPGAIRTQGIGRTGGTSCRAARNTASLCRQQQTIADPARSGHPLHRSWKRPLAAILAIRHQFFGGYWVLLPFCSWPWLNCWNKQAETTVPEPCRDPGEQGLPKGSSAASDKLDKNPEEEHSDQAACAYGRLSVRKAGHRSFGNECRTMEQIAARKEHRGGNSGSAHCLVYKSSRRKIRSGRKRHWRAL